MREKLSWDPDCAEVHVWCSGKLSRFLNLIHQLSEKGSVHIWNSIASWNNFLCTLLVWQKFWACWHAWADRSLGVIFFKGWLDKNHLKPVQVQENCESFYMWRNIRSSDGVSLDAHKNWVTSQLFWYPIKICLWLTFETLHSFTCDKKGCWTMNYGGLLHPPVTEWFLRSVLAGSSLESSWWEKQTGTEHEGLILVSLINHTNSKVVGSYR